MLHLIDSLHLSTPRLFALAVIEAAPDHLIMIDCGPANVFANVVGELRKRGLDPEHVRELFATHIHLDHNGGAWRWQKEFGTIIHVHPKERRTWSIPPGWWEVQPGSTESKWTISGARSKESGKRGPHHARRGSNSNRRSGVAGDRNAGARSTSQCYWLSSERLLFAGDIAGVAIGGGPILPPCPPPDIDIEAWLSSIEKIEKIDPNRLCLTHFGLFTDPESHLKELSDRLVAWAEWIKMLCELANPKVPSSRNLSNLPSKKYCVPALARKE